MGLYIENLPVLIFGLIGVAGFIFLDVEKIFSHILNGVRIFIKKKIIQGMKE